MTVVYWVLGIIVLLAVWGLFKIIVAETWEALCDGNAFPLVIFLLLTGSGLGKLFAL